MCFNLRRASRLITQVYDEAIRTTGFRTTQLALLGATTYCQPMTVSCLAECVGMDRTTLTRNLRPLEKKGLVKVLVGNDRREREVVLTVKGKELMNRVLPIMKKVHDKITNLLGQARVERLIRDLNSALDQVAA